MRTDAAPQRAEPAGAGSPTSSQQPVPPRRGDGGWIGAPVHRWSALPDRLTQFRLAAVPALWIVALLGETTWLGAGLALAAFTDVLDGAIARRYRWTSAYGSRLDSLADHALTASTALWLLWLRPAFVAEQLPLLGIWAAVGVTALVVGWLRFRRIGDLHLYSAKVAGTLGYLFAIGLLLFDSYHPTAFYLVIAVALVASLESLAAVSLRSTVDEHIGSVLRVPSRRRTGADGRR